MESLFNTNLSSGLSPPDAGLTPLVVHHYQGCIDLHGQSIPHGLLFAPGPDECQVKQTRPSFNGVSYQNSVCIQCS